jgi:hypothetical protein
VIELSHGQTSKARNLRLAQDAAHSVKSHDRCAVERGHAGVRRYDAADGQENFVADQVQAVPGLRCGQPLETEDAFRCDERVLHEVLGRVGQSDDGVTVKKERERERTIPGDHEKRIQELKRFQMGDVPHVMDGHVVSYVDRWFQIECPDAPPHLQCLNLVPGQMMGALVGDHVRLTYHVTSRSGLWNVTEILKRANL